MLKLGNKINTVLKNVESTSSPSCHNKSEILSEAEHSVLELKEM